LERESLGEKRRFARRRHAPGGGVGLVGCLNVQVGIPNFVGKVYERTPGAGGRERGGFITTVTSESAAREVSATEQPKKETQHSKTAKQARSHGESALGQRRPIRKWGGRKNQPGRKQTEGSSRGSFLGLNNKKHENKNLSSVKFHARLIVEDSKKGRR